MEKKWQGGGVRVEIRETGGDAEEQMYKVKKTSIPYNKKSERIRKENSL